MPIILFAPDVFIYAPGVHTFTIGNDAAAGADLVIGTASIVDDADGVFSIVPGTNPDGQTLVPGAATTVSVSFSPPADVADTYTGTLRIPSNDPDGVYEISLRATAVLAPAPIITVDPASWDAGTTASAYGQSQTVINIGNSGNAPLVIGTVALAGSSFSAPYGDGMTGHTLQPGDTAGFSIRFVPTTTGAKTGSLTIPNNAGADIVVPLTGTGTKTGTVYPTSWEAGALYVTGYDTTATFTVTSTGTIGLTFGTLSVTGDYALSNDGISGNGIAPAGTATVDVTFDPTTTGGRAGVLTIPSDRTAGDLTATLNGSGISDAAPPPPTPPEPPAPPTPSPTYVSRFYLSRAGAPSGVTVPDTGWNVHTPASVADNYLGTSKSGPSPFWGWETNTGFNLNTTTRLGRWIGPPMAAQARSTIAYTAYCTAAYRSSVLGNTITSALRIGVWRTADSTIDWNAIQAHTSPIDPWPEAGDPLPRRMPAGLGGSWTAYLGFAQGDRIVIEAGVRRCGSGAVAGVRMRWGGASTDTDLADTQTAQSLDRASWIDFSIALPVATWLGS